MDRGCPRRPLSRFRPIILMTIAGLALAAILPVVRSSPGLSRTPAQSSMPVGLGFSPVTLCDFDYSEDAESSPIPSDWRQEESSEDSESPAEESPSAEWLAIRPSRGRDSERSRWLNEIPSFDPRVHAPTALRPRWAHIQAGTPRLDLTLRLCRLLI